MTSRKYLLAVALVVLGLAIPFMAFNFVSDDFGLFWSKSPKRVWTLEKTSKYLMSYRYIPQKFDGLLIGPSYSDGLMDTRQLQGYRVYNLSMEGGNATELRAATINAINRGQFKYLIICLSSYITKNSGLKDGQISSKDYFGSLLSVLPVEVWQAKWLARRPDGEDPYAGSEWGAPHLSRPHYSFEDFVRREQSEPLDDPRDDEIDIDPIAFRDLKEIIQTARQHGMRVFAYFFPNDQWRAASVVQSGAWTKYRSQILTLFDQKVDVVWDMMGPEYSGIRDDTFCYTDSHLSEAGVRLVMGDIRRKLDENLLSLPASGPAHFGPLACINQPGAGSGGANAGIAGRPAP